MKTIVNVKYEDPYVNKLFAGKEYSYYCEFPVDVGALVLVPTFYGDKVAKVTRINVPKEEILKVIKKELLTITKPLSKEEHLKLKGVA